MADETRQSGNAAKRLESAEDVLRDLYRWVQNSDCSLTLAMGNQIRAVLGEERDG